MDRRPVGPIDSRRFRLADTPLKIAVAFAGATAGAVVLGAVAGDSRAGATGIVTCPLRALTGLPCPFCGMTRSLMAIGDADIDRAVVLAPAIPIVLIAAVFFVLVGPRRVLTGRAVQIPRWIALGALLAVSGAWVLRLTGVLPPLPAV